MEEERIKFETAKLSKEKEFPQEDYPCYSDDNKIHSVAYFLSNSKKNDYFASTQSLLQRWLREQKDICVYCVPNLVVAEVWHYRIDKTYSRLNMESQHYQTYEEALEFGLLEGLKLI